MAVCGKSGNSLSVNLKENFLYVETPDSSATYEGARINKHDQYVEQLYNKIKDDYDVVERHVVLSGKRGMKAEIDLIGYKDGRVDVFEVKCSFRIVKARKQLRRIQRLLNLDGMTLLFYCGMADKLERIAA